MRRLALAALLLVSLAGCSGKVASKAEAPGPDDGLAVHDWANKTFSGTAYALATPGGWAADPRDASSHTFVVPAGAVRVEVVVEAGSGGIGFTLREPECQGQVTAPTSPQGCERAGSAQSGPARKAVADPKPGTWSLDVTPPAGAGPGPWQADYLASVAVQSS